MAKSSMREKAATQPLDSSHESSRPRHRVGGSIPPAQAAKWTGRLLLQPLMRPGVVVVGKVLLEHTPEMLLAENQQVVEAFLRVPFEHRLRLKQLHDVAQA